MARSRERSGLSQTVQKVYRRLAVGDFEHSREQRIRRTVLIFHQDVRMGVQYDGVGGQDNNVRQATSGQHPAARSLFQFRVDGLCVG